MYREPGFAIRAPRIIVVVLAAAVMTTALLATPEIARATCFSSTPTSASFGDPAGDTIGADILQVDLALDTGCGVTINPIMGSALTANDVVFTWVNTDSNEATGDQDVGGADKVVQAEAGFPPVLFGCSVTPCEGSGGEALVPVGDAGFATDLNQLGLPAPTTLGVVVEADHVPPPPDPVVADFAPDSPPAYGFPVSFATSLPVAPPPVAAPTPAPPLAPKAKKKRCKVPRLKGRSVARARKALKKAGCKYKIRGRGRVISTRPKAGTLTRDTVLVRAKKKRKRNQRRAAIANPEPRPRW